MSTENTLNEYYFDLDAFFPMRVFNKITDVRVMAPQIILNHALARRRRPNLTADGKLTILAADHPGRGVTAIGSDPFRMADRREYLGRILRVLTATEFDGFMSTPDMIEDLLIVDYLVQEGGGPSFLNDKVLVGCMQRGGVAGVKGELDDRFGSYTAESIQQFNLDGGKMMFRFVPDDERTIWQIDYCAKAITALNHYDLTSFVEPLRMDYVDGKWISNNTADELLKIVGVIGALGDSTRRTWMKLPYCEGYNRVALGTTQPILMLGGPSRQDPRGTFVEFSAGMAAGGNVRGALVGRNITFPGYDDPAAVARAIFSIVHQGANVDRVIQDAAEYRDTQIDFFKKYVR